jgi:hypothetical protein
LRKWVKPEGGLNGKTGACIYAPVDFLRYQATGLRDADSGLKGANLAAIKSALMNLRVCAFAGKKPRANVVLPAPFGPAMMIIFFKWALSSSKRQRLSRVWNDVISPELECQLTGSLKHVRNQPLQ